ncbi:ABC-2 type transport system ATP-binding protein [Arthrobacter silviterrae]|uniref:ABC transporter ATP-binding protein n=1 Tax=Arthrobacter silviterrae TaxID=2026658 RepID=A0ABX0DMN2_9MICC|nr:MULTISPECIES: ABC transporter ATP-binding protein [Arthrobacter]MCU6481816.1 ABC transporter ATP-binding protein [Arthrobacter sp. A2-55]MDQ0277505.1 ABC-2 type transport system ATP-binding protein [Arthrobacter silviterrae]NGN85488.1 ABC transporter ATP-binding protein [Arthrobacter silviterrae]
MTDTAISTTALTKRYGSHQALNELTLSVPSGEIFGLLGHNGAGKTTIVNLLTTLMEPSSGTAVIGGHDIATASNQVRRSIGYLPENVQFYDNLTLAENLLFFARLSGVRAPGARIRDVLEFLDFTGRENHRMGTFSKGMRQRAGIAQAIVHNPSVLFLDEPTSGLDPQGVARLREIIIALNTDLGMTIFMNTHLLAEVTKTCTSIGILSSGTLIYQDSVAATLDSFPGQESLEDIYLHIEAGQRS